MMNNEDIAKKIKVNLPSWVLVNNALQRNLEFKSTPVSLHFTNRLATLAEQQHHHPTVIIDGRELQIELFTHDTGGITKKDFVLAEEINTLIKIYSHGMVHEK